MAQLIVLHMFVPGSGECALHKFMHVNGDILDKLGLSYPQPREDMVYGSMSHRTLQEHLVAIRHTPEPQAQSALRLYVRQWLQEIAATFHEQTTPVLSIRFPMLSGISVLWEAWKSLPELRSCIIRPVLTLTHQENYVEFQARHTLWYQPQKTWGDIFLQTDYADYLKSITVFNDAAKANGIQTLPLTVLWHEGEPAAADAAYVKDFLMACGATVPQDFSVHLPEEELRAYHTLQFAALTLPQRASIFYRHLGTDAQFALCTWPEAVLQEVPGALRRAEDEGAVSLAPLSSAALRKIVEGMCSTGNAALALAYPHLAPAIQRPARYAACVTEEEQGPLDDTLIHTLLDCCTSAQREALRNRLRAGGPLLCPEQERILQCLNAMYAAETGTPVCKSRPLVSVLTLTKNHCKYIVQNMESVLAQQTNFPVQHIIVDDGSTDGTQDIIADYACRHESIKAVLLREKPHDGDNVRLLFRLVRTPFAALCDGDDYFTDPLKLQKQVDLLRAHPDYGLCFHPVSVIYQDGSAPDRIYPPLESMPRGVRDFYYLGDLIKANFIQTNSVMYRWRFMDGLPGWFDPTLLPGDWYWHLLHAEMGKVGFQTDVMSVYRRHGESLYHSADGPLIEHRLQHGMEELRTYTEVNKHFGGKYERILSFISNGIFANYLQHYLETEDVAPLEKALETYPLFGKYFMSEVKIMQASGTPKAGEC